MKYKELSEIFYAQRDKYEDEYRKRINSETTIVLPCDIYGEKAFISNTFLLTLVLEKIAYNAIQITKLAEILPNIAIDSYRRSCLIDEIQMSNAMEGVQSSRSEIRDAIYENSKAKRFKGMITKYEKLLHDSNENINLTTVQDIRALYNDVVSDEIEKKDVLDGILFRKDRVYVRDSRQNIIHEGVMPEGKIIENLANALAMLNDKDIPILYRIAAFHYYIGYIHPFYDGNGRVSRFISSYLIGKEIHPLVALGLSMAIKEDKNKYYKSFKKANDSKNKADLTPFVIQFLTFILKSTQRALEKLSLGKNALASVISYINIKYEDNVFNKREVEMLGVLAQNTFFSVDRFNLKELESVLGKSWNTVKKTIEGLQRKGVPIELEKQGNSKIIKFDVSGFLSKED